MSEQFLIGGLMGFFIGVQVGMLIIKIIYKEK